jgi:plastocyanin
MQKLTSIAACVGLPVGTFGLCLIGLVKAQEAPKLHPAPTTQVTIDNFTFSPQSLTIAPGTIVTWVNHDDVPHTATSSAKPREFGSRALDTDDKFSHTFSTPGTYPYFCAVHPHMTGTIIVTRPIGQTGESK